MVETLGADYIRTARAKGYPGGDPGGHALRNAALPALAFTGMQAGFLLGGAVIVEGVFAYPGSDGLALDAVADRDIPLVEAFVWVVAVLILAVNTLLGVLAAWLDPRLRDGRMTSARRRPAVSEVDVAVRPTADRAPVPSPPFYASRRVAPVRFPASGAIGARCSRRWRSWPSLPIGGRWIPKRKTWQIAWRRPGVSAARPRIPLGPDAGSGGTPWRG